MSSDFSLTGSESINSNNEDDLKVLDIKKVGNN